MVTRQFLVRNDRFPGILLTQHALAWKKAEKNQLAALEGRCYTQKQLMAGLTSSVLPELSCNEWSISCLRPL